MASLSTLLDLQGRSRRNARTSLQSMEVRRREVAEAERAVAEAGVAPSAAVAGEASARLR